MRFLNIRETAFDLDLELGQGDRVYEICCRIKTHHMSPTVFGAQACFSSYCWTRREHGFLGDIFMACKSARNL